MRLWQLNSNQPVGTIEIGANVCSVQFAGSPNSQLPANSAGVGLANPRWHLVVGAADHFVYLYDIRHSRNALAVFRNHSKAVSYTKFLSNSHIISAYAPYYP